MSSKVILNVEQCFIGSIPKGGPCSDITSWGPALRVLVVPCMFLLCQFYAVAGYSVVIILGRIIAVINSPRADFELHCLMPNGCARMIYDVQ